MTLHPTACPFDCPDACGALIETDHDGNFVGLRGNPEHSWSRGHLCGKTAIYHELFKPGQRLGTPLVRKGQELVSASWDEALDRVAEGLEGVAGEELLALHYAGHMGLVNRRFPMRVMNALGATDTDGGICDTTSTVGYQSVLGHAVGPDLERVTEAGMLVVWGCDARRTVQHLMPRIRELCKKSVPVVVIDVYRSDTVRTVEAWGGTSLLLNPGTDAMLALGLCELAFQRGAADLAYLKAECTGAAELRAEVAGRYPLEEVCRVTGLERAAIESFADLRFKSRDLWFKVGVGWNRRRNGASSMRAVCSLAAVLGAAEHLHYESFEHFGLDEDVLDRPDLRPVGAPDPIKQVEAGVHLSSDRFRACVVWGHNPAVTLPNSRAVRAGLGRSDLFLVVHELVMTETAQLADVVLPATALPEHTDIYRSYGHRILQVGRAVCQPPDEQRSNVDTFSALGERLGLDAAVWDTTQESLLEELLEASSSRFSGDELVRLRAGEPVKLSPRQLPDRGTPSGKIELASEACEGQGLPRVATYTPDDGCKLQGRYWFHPTPSTATHNSTFTRSERHLARSEPARLRISEADAESESIQAGERVRVENAQGALTLEVEVSSDLPSGMVSVVGFPDPRSTPEGLSSNALTSSLVSDMGDGNVQYSARVDLVRLDQGA